MFTKIPQFSRRFHKFQLATWKGSINQGLFFQAQAVNMPQVSDRKRESSGPLEDICKCKSFIHWGEMDFLKTISQNMGAKGQRTQGEC